MSAARQAELSNAGEHEALALHPGRLGFFTLFVKPLVGKPSQKSHKIKNRPEVLQALDRTRDSFISQAEFFKPNRRLVNLWRVPLRQLQEDGDVVFSLVAVEAAGPGSYGRTIGVLPEDI